MAALLGTDAHLDEALPDILIIDEGTFFSCSFDRSFIEEVLKICARESRCGPGKLLEIDIISYGLVLGMYFKYFLSALHIGKTYGYLSVESSGTEYGRIEDIHTVGGCKNYYAFIYFKTIHLHKELVKSLLTLVVTAAHSGASLSAHSIYLIDKYKTGCILLGIRKEVSDSGCADADEHLNEIGTRDGEKGHLSLSGYGFCQKSLTGSGLSLQQNTLGDPCSKLIVLCGILKEINYLIKILFFFRKTCHIIECHFAVCDQLGSALAEIHQPAVAAT